MRSCTGSYVSCLRIQKRRSWRHEALEQLAGLRFALLEDPITPWSTALFASGSEHHDQANRAQQFQQPGESLAIAQLARLELDHAPEQKCEQAAEGMHLDLVVGPVIPGADRQVLMIFELTKRLFHLTRV